MAVSRRCEIPLVHTSRRLGRAETRYDRPRAIVDEWLERAFDDRSRGMDNMNVNPAFDRLRGDSRFDRIVRRMNLIA